MLGTVFPWLSNIYIPRLEEGDEDYENEIRTARRVVLGPPQATSAYSVLELTEMGFAGVYAVD